MLAAATLAAANAKAADTIPEITVIGRQLPPLATERLYSATPLDRSRLDRAPQARLDEVLRSIPGFSLFRRQSSSASHPTTQGVTLRGLGPSGAGRTLLLLDGIPQNDPFGGWIDWGRLPTQSLEQILVTRGGGAGEWGNFALAGTIKLKSLSDGGTVEVRADSKGGFEGTAHVHVPAEGWSGFATASGHSTGGAFLVREDQRGPIDIESASRGGVLSMGTEFALTAGTQVSIGGRYSEDRFINGIEAAVSRSKIGDGYLSVVHDGGADAPSWEFHTYYRNQTFASVFVAVNAARTTATPSLDQFRVPANAFGGSGKLRFPLGETMTLETGADVRKVTGETNERFTRVNDAFTRLRSAGGAQLTGGAFAELSWDITPTLSAIGALRVDYWRQFDGKRRETSIVDGTILIDDEYAERDGYVANYRAGLRWEASDGLALRGLFYSGYRAPTLNELYRPFRVGNDITEANPALAPEQLHGGEIGFEYQAAASVRLSGSYFYNRLDDGIGNITIQTTPGLNSDLNVFVPSGGVLRQRQNIRRITSGGFDGEAALQLTDFVSLTLRYLYARPIISRSDVEPTLVGKRLAQVSLHQGSAALTWQYAPWTVSIEMRGAGDSFEDDQNVRKLKGYVTTDFYASWWIADAYEVFISGENIFDRTIEAGKSTDGRVTIGDQRSFSGGLRVRF